MRDEWEEYRNMHHTDEYEMISKQRKIMEEKERVKILKQSPEYLALQAQIAELEREIVKINTEYTMITKSFCEKNDEKIQKLQDLIREARPCMEYLRDHLDKNESTFQKYYKWLKQYEEVMK